ncbi:unnamed protein product, partial [Mesorhabditis spiculigera]
MFPAEPFRAVTCIPRYTGKHEFTWLCLTWSNGTNNRQKNLPNITAVECSRRGNFEKAPQVSLPTKHHRGRMLIRKVAISSTLTRLCIANNKQGPVCLKKKDLILLWKIRIRRASCNAKHNRGRMFKNRI